MVDNTGVVKVIDFGIGKVFDAEHQEDSLHTEINRENSDTLPLEYYSREYTSLTDMFYLAELLNRLMNAAPHADEMNFSYQSILDKMMKKDPNERYLSFKDVKEAIGKHDFVNLNISEKDKQLYQDFSNLVYHSVVLFTSEPKFVTDPKYLIDKLQKALHVNAFETVIQKNTDVIGCIVLCAYRYDNSVDIPYQTVKNFLDWFISSTSESQELILSNLAAKLSIIRYDEPDDELPF